MDFFDQVFTLFMQFLKQEQPLLDNLSHHKFTYDHQQWQFSLPQLYKFIQSTKTTFPDVTYNEFRQQLFQCPFNQQLAKHNAEIIILQNNHNVDLSTYALQLSWHA